MYWSIWIINFKLIIYLYINNILNGEKGFYYYFIKYILSNKNLEKNLII